MRIGPFERHPAVPESVENRADTFVRLAEEAGDHQTLTDRAFQPAVASWDGVAAPELQAAPVGVRRDAAEVAVQVAWAAVPLRIWADHVRSFNCRADDLLQEQGQIPGQVERFIRERYPGVDSDYPTVDLESERAWKHSDLLFRLRQQWHEAHDHHIDEGEREVAAMLRHGPTLDGLALAKELGVLPAGPMAEFFAARWEVTAAASEAERIADLLRDPDHDPTNEELEQLADLLDEYAENDEFAYLLALGLGPEGVIETNVAVIGLADQYDHEALARIQAGLGTALATATTGRGEYVSDPYQGGRVYQPAEFELPPEWIVQLTEAGRQLYPVSIHGEPEIYGYQGLGPLLSHGVYDERFLEMIGGDMLDFEMQLGGSAGWPPLLVGTPPEWVSLDLSLSGDQALLDRAYGHDPIANLMDAFEANPYGARAALAGRTATAEDGVEYLPRVDYLVTDREWGTESGLQQFGRVLEHATGVSVERLPTGEFHQLYPPDDRSYRIVESIVYAVANDEEVKGYPNDPSGQGRELGDQALGFAQAEIVPDALRPYLGRVVAGYIDDVHWSMGDIMYPHEDLPGEQQLRIASTGDTKILLAELGKNAEARDTIMLAEELYLAALYDHYLSGGGGQEGMAALIAAETNGLAPAAKIFGALDYGAATEIDEKYSSEAAAFNGALRGQYVWFGAGVALVEDLGVPGVIGYTAQEMLDQSEEHRQANLAGHGTYDQMTLRELGRERLTVQTEAAVYRNLELAELPAYLRDEVVGDDGELKPIDDWIHDEQSPEFRAWHQYRSNEGGHDANNPRQAAEREYEIWFGQAKTDLHTHISQK